MEYGPDKADEIEALAAAKDYENYVVAVHSLKSVADNIGAHQLFTMAKIHEFAGKGGNTGFIEANSSKLVSLYREIISNIKKALEELNKERD